MNFILPYSYPDTRLPLLLILFLSDINRMGIFFSVLYEGFLASSACRDGAGCVSESLPLSLGVREV